MAPALTTSASEIDRLLGRAAESGPISREDALLLAARAELGPLLEAARRVRARFHRTTVSFSKKVFIPLTPLCRDRCGYCTFRRDPGDPGGRYMTPEEVLAVAENARAAGCKEALFSLGDQPERAFPEARRFLEDRGYRSTLHYLAAMSRLVLDRTGLLPHANPGLMGRGDLEALRETNVSLGLMLENVSPRLLRKPGPHWLAPDKLPRLRLHTLEEAGRLRIPFTTGILIGIGETMEERVDSLLAIRAFHAEYGHIQEVIVQNFRAKAGTRMAGWPDLSMDPMLRTLALARLILPGEIHLQAPPNLSYASYPSLLEAGIDDWGGISPVTRDFINPEAAWPQIAGLRQKTAEAGLTLRERLAIYPEFAFRPEFVDPGLIPSLRRLCDDDGYARDPEQPAE
jgi:7,8-didemethyl-8-hydroxy-5-deazariboflavin synthase CofG subunit